MQAAQAKAEQISTQGFQHTNDGLEQKQYERVLPSPPTPTMMLLARTILLLYQGTGCLQQTPSGTIFQAAFGFAVMMMTTAHACAECLPIAKCVWSFGATEMCLKHVCDIFC